MMKIQGQRHNFEDKRRPRPEPKSKEVSVGTHKDVDWTSFDIQSALRALNLNSEEGCKKVLRKLHLRWWHAGVKAMTRLLRQAGVPQEKLDLIPPIVETCRVCRMWTRPGVDSVPSVRVIVGFNEEVEGDLIFYDRQPHHHIIFHLVCRGVRWEATREVMNKEDESLIRALDECWISIFGPMKVLIFDGESGLDGPRLQHIFH